MSAIHKATREVGFAEIGEIFARVLGMVVVSFVKAWQVRLSVHQSDGVAFAWWEGAASRRGRVGRDRHSRIPML